MKHDHGLSRQALAAAELIKALAEHADDQELIHDSIEGETSFFEAAERALNEINDCSILLDGIAAARGRLEERASRVKARSEKLRGLVDQAFQMAEIKSHAFPEATVTIKKVPPKVVVTDESLLPSKLFKEQPPKLDAAALKAALKDGDVPGASMSNGGTTIQIRRG